jgi:hypothetical protein
MYISLGWTLFYDYIRGLYFTLDVVSLLNTVHYYIHLAFSYEDILFKRAA